MFYRSLFTNAFTACALFSGEIALADSFNISNDDSSAYSLINSLGEPLNAGNAILGTFSSGTWSYDGPPADGTSKAIRMHRIN